MDHIKKILEQKAVQLSSSRPLIDEQELKNSFIALVPDLDFAIRIKAKKLILVAPDSMVATELFARRTQILKRVQAAHLDISAISIKTELSG